MTAPPEPEKPHAAFAPVAACIALGANLDDPLAQLRAASAALAELPETRLLRCSSFYRTAPVGIRGQPDFINAVALIETRLDAHALLDRLQAVEQRFGRRRDYHHAPRTLDLDLLLYGKQTSRDPRLELPHPRMHLRAFVLVPLLEILPGCRIPGRGSAAAWLAAATGQRIERIAGS